MVVMHAPTFPQLPFFLSGLGPLAFARPRTDAQGSWVLSCKALGKGLRVPYNQNPMEMDLKSVLTYSEMSYYPKLGPHLPLAKSFYGSSILPNTLIIRYLGHFTGAIEQTHHVLHEKYHLLG